MRYVLYVLAFLVFGFILSLIIVPFYIYKKFFLRKKDEDIIKNSMADPHYDICRERVKEYREKLDLLPYKELCIKSFDNLNLYGKYYDIGSDTVIILFPGVRTVKEDSFAYECVNMLDLGYNVLLCDNRAHFKSEGEFISYGLYEKEDVKKWVEYFENDDKITNIFPGGKSMGAASVSFASKDLNEIDKVKGLIIDCGYTNVIDLFSYLLKTMHVPSFLVIPGLSILLKSRKGISFKNYSTENYLSQISLPCLFIEGTDDKVVPIEYVMKNYNCCTGEKELFLVEKAGHTTAIPVSGDEGIKKINEFIKKYS